MLIYLEQQRKSSYVYVMKWNADEKEFQQKCWKDAKLHPIAKNKDLTDPSNCWPVSFLIYKEK